jgi:hypothetical protein
MSVLPVAKSMGPEATALLQVGQGMGEHRYVATSHIDDQGPFH